MSSAQTAQIAYERDQIDEIERLKQTVSELQTKVTELQTLGSKHVLERQAMNRFGGRRQRQRVVLGWASRVFGTVTCNVRERAFRLIEEAIEVAQAAGIEVNLVERILYRVYSREAGDVYKEMGGLLITTLAMCEMLNADADELERDELERILALPESLVREKHDHKRALGIAL